MGLPSISEVKYDDFWMRTALAGRIRQQNKKDMKIIFDYLYYDQSTANVKPIHYITLTIFNIT
jgi:hypothetical protein